MINSTIHFIEIMVMSARIRQLVFQIKKKSHPFHIYHMDHPGLQQGTKKMTMIQTKKTTIHFSTSKITP